MLLYGPTWIPFASIGGHELDSFLSILEHEELSVWCMCLNKSSREWVSCLCVVYMHLPDCVKVLV